MECRGGYGQREWQGHGDEAKSDFHQRNVWGRSFFPVGDTARSRQQPPFGAEPGGLPFLDLRVH
jgi:hypothetical protein